MHINDVYPAADCSGFSVLSYSISFFVDMYSFFNLNSNFWTNSFHLMKQHSVFRMRQWEIDFPSGVLVWLRTLKNGDLVGWWGQAQCHDSSLQRGLCHTLNHDDLFDIHDAVALSLYQGATWKWQGKCFSMGVSLLANEYIWTGPLWSWELKLGLAAESTAVTSALYLLSEGQRV